MLVSHYVARCTHSDKSEQTANRQLSASPKQGIQSSPRPDEVNFECLLVDLGGWSQASAVLYWTIAPMAHLGQALG